ncbi:MAG TPA: DNA ligase (NAD(+)) LigA, partial [Lachnospiraceae bacterium]|nr:DNA ligase (NAD(+)) LigA [Lachnospiraceae bacterium]
MNESYNEIRNRMQELVTLLNQANLSYEQKNVEIMSNFTYDKLYDELKKLEEDSGVILADSPTQKVGYEVVSELEKERHEKPMLSLDKTKDPVALADWLGANKGLLSWKMDGLTVVLTYEEGQLVKAVTRGNGEIGEVITQNAKHFKNLPLTIPFKGKLILRGEAVISYAAFEKINETIGDADAKYKNPRNLCSGSVRQLDSKVTASRNVNVFIFALVQMEGMNFKFRHQEFEYLRELGFEVVEERAVDQKNIQEEIINFKNKIVTNEYPSDGLVLILDDIAYGESLGLT